MPEVSQPAFDAFCANLLKGLHAAAQPLTILRAGLSRECTEWMEVEDLRELTHTAEIEIERLCDLFSLLKQLIQAERFLAYCSGVQLPPLIEKALQEFQLAAPRLRVLASVPESLPEVRAEVKHAAQALSLLLRIGRSTAAEQATLELTAQAEAGHVTIQLRNPDLNLHAMNAENSLALALADARMRSQGGSLQWALNPLTLTLTFKTPDASDGEARNG